MSEAHVTTRPVQRWVTPVLIAAIVAIFAFRKPHED